MFLIGNLIMFIPAGIISDRVEPKAILCSCLLSVLSQTNEIVTIF